MAFTVVNSLEADTTISLGGTNRKTNKPNPTSIEGYYLGSRQVEDKKKKSGVSFIYIFQTSKGNVGVWGKTDMDRKMAQTSPGVMTRVTSTGTRPTPNGDMYTYKVEVDRNNTIEVEAPTMARRLVEAFETGLDADDEAFPSTFASREELDEEDDSQEEALRQAEARKAKVAALLKKKA